MSGLSELNKIIKNSKFISDKDKLEYEHKINVNRNDSVDFLKDIFGMKDVTTKNEK